MFGEKLTAKNFSVDHAAPISRGGSHKLDNLIVCSRSGNLAKGVMTLKEFSKLRDAMANNTPKQQWQTAESSLAPPGILKTHAVRS